MLESNEQARLFWLKRSKVLRTGVNISLALDVAQSSMTKKKGYTAKRESLAIRAELLTSTTDGVGNIRLTSKTACRR